MALSLVNHSITKQMDCVLKSPETLKYNLTNKFKGFLWYQDFKRNKTELPQN